MAEQKSSGKSIIICERKSDAPLAIQRVKDGTIKFISANPDVCYELTKVKIKYTDIATFYPDDLENTDKSYDKILEMCDAIDAKNAFNAGKDNYYFIKMLYDALYIRSIALKRIIDKEKPNKIIVFEDEKTSQNGDLHYPFNGEDNIYAMLLRTGKFGCEYEVLQRPKKPKKYTAISEPVKKREVPQALYNILYCTKTRGLGPALKTAVYAVKNKIVGEKKLVTMSKFNYSWQHIIPELYKNGFSLSYLDLSEYMIHRPGEQTGNLESVKKYCIAEGIDFSEPFLYVLRKKIVRYDEEKQAIYNATVAALKAQKPVALVGSTKPTYREHLIAKAASDHWIPVVTWQHGAAYPPDYSRMIPFTEMMGSDVHLAFGEGYLEFERKFGCMVEPVGSYDLERLHFSHGKRRKEFDVLYATTAYSENLYYSGTGEDNKVWAAQKAILDLLVQQRHLRIAVKLHPTSKDDHPIYKYLGENLEIFKNERSYSSLMKGSKVVIVDYPSTTMLEAIAAGKEVLVLSDQIRLTEDQTTLLEKRVYLSDNIDDFVVLLEAYINGDISDRPDRENTEFLIKYGTHTLDKKVANRAISALKKITGDKGRR